MGSEGEDAYVTLLNTDGYLPGAMVLAHSLRDNGTRKKLVALVTTDSLSAATIEELRTVYDTIIPVPRIRNRNPANLYLMNRPDLDSAFTKIQLWKQTQYRKIVYLDADIVTLRAPDELFNLPEPFSAAPDIGWPDLFNSGVMVLKPNMGDYYALMALADRGISFDGADQGLLNMHFKNYNRISFAYNCTPSGHYQYLPAYRHFQSTISMIHYIGNDKPWRVGRDFGAGSGAYPELLGRWWATYDKHYRLPVDSRTRNSSDPQTVRKYVAGEQLLPLSYGPPQAASQPPPAIVVDQPRNVTFGSQQYEQPRSTTEEPTVETHADANYGGEPQAITAPAVQERRFSAPHAEWNPAVQAPPAHAKPEAANFPQHIYSMSADNELFQPPAAYPEPPRDMWYQVPERQPPTRPKPIFPWEENQAPPTRVFPQEVQPPPPPTAPVSQLSSGPSSVASSGPLGDEFTVSPPEESVTSGSQEASDTTRTFRGDTTPFSPTQVPFVEYRGTNVWDDNDGISKYMNALQNRRKGGVQVLALNSALESEVVSPGGRRPSMKITDFPTHVERPSLPVTPAPIRRNMFWGSERDSEGNLPEADGVVTQDEWNPEAQLEQLRRNSLLFAEEPSKESVMAPLRTLPASSRGIGTSPQEEMLTKNANLASEAVETNESHVKPADGPTRISQDGPLTGSFGSDGTGSSKVVWVDHATAASTVEAITSAMGTSQTQPSTTSMTTTTMSSSFSSESQQKTEAATSTPFKNIDFNPPVGRTEPVSKNEEPPS